MVKGEQEYSIYLMKKQYTFRTINIFKKSTYYNDMIRINFINLSKYVISYY